MPSESPAPSRAELARELLRYKMMEYSEDMFCATWLGNLESLLWTEAERVNPEPSQEYTVAFSRECRVLGEIAGGWWVYEDKTCPRDRGPVFISMERWLEILSERPPNPPT